MKQHLLLSLTLWLAGILSCIAQSHTVVVRGGIIRSDTTRKRVTLLFTGADFADGAEDILRTLKAEKVKGAFFLTGKFVQRHADIVHQLVKQGHYVGSHSHGHLLYFPWNSPQMSISQSVFEEDIRRSYADLAPFGITIRKAPYFVPPFEHYNDTVAAWAKSMGLILLNFTPGSTSNADYTTPQMHNYRSSQTILDNILRLEAQQGLQGHLLLFHLGTSPLRTDKFYRSHLQKLIQELKQRGYKFNNLKKNSLLKDM